MYVRMDENAHSASFGRSYVQFGQKAFLKLAWVFPGGGIFLPMLKGHVGAKLCGTSIGFRMGLCFRPATATLPLDEPMAPPDAGAMFRLPIASVDMVATAVCTGSFSRRCSPAVVCTGSFSRRCSPGSCAPEASSVVARPQKKEDMSPSLCAPGASPVVARAALCAREASSLVARARTLSPSAGRLFDKAP